MKVLSSAILLVASMLEPALAGPDETTLNLIADPASMLDIGILRSDLALARKNLGAMTFDWEANRFYISQFIFQGDFLDQESAEAECASWVSAVRLEGAIRAESGTPYYDYSAYAENFSHEGFQRTNAPTTLYEDIDKLIILKCVVFVGEISVAVTAPLLGTSYSVEKVNDGD